MQIGAYSNTFRKSYVSNRQKISSIENVSTHKRWHMSTFCWSNVKVIWWLEIHYNTDITKFAFYELFFTFWKSIFLNISNCSDVFIFYLIVTINLNLLYWIKQVSKSRTIDIFSYSMTYWKQQKIYRFVLDNKMKWILSFF